MILKDIFETSNNPEYKAIFQNLKDKYGKGEYKNLSLADFCEDGDYQCISGYARKTYMGTLKEDVELTELELSMICDNGYSHFGGSSVISSDRNFTVVIYTD